MMEPKKKFSRTFSRKKRTGCLTCKIRRKKCDEEKPICRRCVDDSFKCDGYIKTSTSSTSSKALSASTHTRYQLPQFLLSDIKYASSAERTFFRHFDEWTTSCPPASALLWREYVLPLAHQDELIKKSVAAVGAAYRYFSISHSSSSSRDLADLERTTIVHYNIAISHILKRTSSGNPKDILSIIVSCLLFVCFEGMMGRHDQLLKHLRAGLRMLEVSDEWKNLRNESLAYVVADLFGHVGVEITIYTEEELFDPARHKMLLPTVSHEKRPFENLQEASIVLKTLDLDVLSTSGCEGPGHGPDFSLDPDIVKSFEVWNKRFELTVAGLEMPALNQSQRLQLRWLKLEQQLWRLVTEYSKHTYQLIWGILWENYLDDAEEVASLLTVGGAPAFSVDSVLVSGLCFAVAAAADLDIKYRALSILKSLNRREGVWDSNEMFEFHSDLLSKGQHSLVLCNRVGTPEVTKSENESTDTDKTDT